MLDYTLEAVRMVGIRRMVVVVGYKAEEVKRHLGDIETVLQEPLLGTGHALGCTEGLLPGYRGTILVLCGDTPLIKKDTIRHLLEEHSRQKAVATLLTTRLDEPKGYGRILRNSEGTILRIVEEEDASLEEREIKEVNAGVYCFSSPQIFTALKEISSANKQKEYYLTDVIEVLTGKGCKVCSYFTEDPQEALGVNERKDLERVREVLRKRLDENGEL